MLVLIRLIDVPSFGEYTTNSPVFLTSNCKTLKTDNSLCSDLCLHSRIESEELAGDNKRADQSRGPAHGWVHLAAGLLQQEQMWE